MSNQFGPGVLTRSTARHSAVVRAGRRLASHLVARLLQGRVTQYLLVPLIPVVQLARLRHPLPPIHSTPETFAWLLDHPRASVSRFGDGEMAVMLGNDINFQPASPSLSTRLQEVLRTKCAGHICCIPYPLRSLRGRRVREQLFWAIHILALLPDWSRFCGRAEYGDSFITRPYMPYRPRHRQGTVFASFESLWRGRRVVLVEGEHSGVGDGNDLLAGAVVVRRILAPATDAWRDYDTIVSQCLDQARRDPDLLFLLALGPTASVLAFDLARAGFQALDIGHIDVEYEWMRRHASRPTLIKGKWVTEAGGLS